MNVDDSLTSRFWAKVKKGRGCWEWTAHKNWLGYGRIGESVTRKILYAHRVSYTIHYGPIPDGLCVLHKCDNPGCVRPDHLFLGTEKDNAIDRQNKGRSNPCKGERHGRAKVTDSDIREMRRLDKLGWAHADIARRFGLSQPQVSGIISGKYWGHID